jgi:uncharacterized membrane protein
MTIRKITFAAVIGAVYAALTMLLAPISYGAVQFRISEALCILPFFFPQAVWGLFVGCALANTISLLGPIDILFGALATLMAGLCTMQLGRLNRSSIAFKAMACLPPVIFNAVIIGAIIAFSGTDASEAFWPLFITSGLQVGLGEIVVLFIIGLPLMVFLPKTTVFKKLSAIYFDAHRIQ